MCGRYGSIDCAASLAVLQYEEAGRRYPGTGRTGHCYSSTDTWPYHSVSPCQVWQYGADFLMYPSIASHLREIFSNTKQL